MTRRRDREEPYPGFPLFRHQNGQWAKKIHKKLRYFGTDAEVAIKRFEQERDALYSGRDPRLYSAGGLTVADGCNLFLHAKELLRKSGELTQVSYDDYERTCKRIIEQFGRQRTVESLTPTDFNELRDTLSKTLGTVALGNEINRVRIVFRYCDDADLIRHPVKFGPHFRRPSAKLQRLAKAQAGSKYVTPEEFDALITKANSRLKAMIYLAINAALGNSDIGHLKREHIDVRGKWLNYPRPKTGIPRRVKLWPETIKAIESVPRRRPFNHEHTDLVFLTQTGRPWKLDKRDNPITKEMRKLIDDCGLRRDGLGFYSLRHTFQTVAEECGDFPAVKSIMGHAPASGDMSSVYRQRMSGPVPISDARLEKVSNFVRRWMKGVKKVSRKVS